MDRERRPNSYFAGEAVQDIPLTPIEGEFVKDAKNVISTHVARTILIVSAVLVGAGIVAENSGSFDPIADSVNSANHLVLNNLHKSYERLKDVPPEVEVASAAHRPCHPLPTAGPPEEGFGFFFTESFANRSTAPGDPAYGVCQDFIPLSINRITVTQNPPGCPTPLTAIAGESKVYINWGIPCFDPGEFVFYKTWHTLPLVGLNTYPIFEADFGGSVGGIAGQPDVEALPQNINSEKSTDYTLPIATGVAGAIATAVVTAGTALHIRRNRSAK